MNEVDVPYSKAVEFILQQLPEIRARYEEEVSFFRGAAVPPDIVFGTVLADYLVDVAYRVLGGEHDQREILTRAFKALEQMARSSSFETRCLVQVSTLESLMDETPCVALFLRNAGPRTTGFAEGLLRPREHQ